LGSSWVTTWDQDNLGRYSPILMNWFHEGVPEAYVIDQKGVIRGHALRLEDIDGLVAPLVERK
jgi:hypothetical protein